MRRFTALLLAALMLLSLAACGQGASAGGSAQNAAGDPTPEEAARAAAESGCAVCVICSTDDTYPEIVPAFCKALREIKPDMMVALAGYPADHVEAFKEAGVDIFIHVRANCYNTIEAIQNKIGL